MIEVDWARLKAHELRKLANEDAIVILPIASIEQHGPHLPVMTDTRLGQEVAHRAARKAYAKMSHFCALLVLAAKSFARGHLSRYKGCVRVGFVPVRVGVNSSSSLWRVWILDCTTRYCSSYGLRQRAPPREGQARRFRGRGFRQLRRRPSGGFRSA